jgi:carbamoyltransferase
VLAEHVPGWFVDVGEDCSPFMSVTASVLAAKRASVPAVTHVDGTARLQTLRRQERLRSHYLAVLIGKPL